MKVILVQFILSSSWEDLEWMVWHHFKILLEVETICENYLLTTRPIIETSLG